MAARSDTVFADDKRYTYVCEQGSNDVPGKIEVAFFAYPAEPPKDDEVTIEIHAAALNFRDVMIALGMLPEKSYEGECVSVCDGTVLIIRRPFLACATLAHAHRSTHFVMQPPSTAPTWASRPRAWSPPWAKTSRS